MRMRYGFWIVLLALWVLPQAVQSQTVVPFNDAHWFFSPYNWTPLGTTETVANEPGAYCSLTFAGSSQAVLSLDTTGIPPAIGSATSTTMVVQGSIDNNPSPPHTLLTTDTQLTLATSLSPSAHTLRFWFVASNNYGSTADYKDRWTQTVPVTGGYLVPPQSLRLTGLSLDSGATVAPPTVRPKRALFFGDSITEGLHVYSANPAISDSARTFAIICVQQLNAEYGIVGNPGQGWVKTLNGSGVPAFGQAFSQFYAGTPRFPLPNGVQAPDYVFLNMGTNDDLSPNDFNGDGLSDLVLQNTVTNQIAVWFLNDAAVLNGAFFPALPDSDYQIVGSDDFNGDGKTVRLLRPPK